ncbi:UPF0739 protein C1orf74 homolog [Onychostruthus taczanowskii]|uniref:UPF0739 protein C1orf74 homolog n=1 Tax=Onychostruthus taczanowskii TaxID=356909 RepID=UPI001B807C39|nr:UPF0739 protein C1orf74 homolog [Onychostruthus taczanowskii]
MAQSWLWALSLGPALRPGCGHCPWVLLCARAAGTVPGPCFVPGLWALSLGPALCPGCGHCPWALLGPRLCAPAEARAVRRHLAALLGHLRDAEASSAEPVTASEVVASGWNLCTVAGVLLGYPAVYTFAEGAENCLALTPLRLFTARASCPRIKDGLRVQIYSFSVPESLCAELGDVLDAWRQELKEAFSAQSDFVDLCISSEVVSLPAVAL